MYVGRYNLHQDGILNVFLPEELFDKCHLYYKINHKYTIIFVGVVSFCCDQHFHFQLFS